LQLCINGPIFLDRFLINKYKNPKDFQKAETSHHQILYSS